MSQDDPSKAPNPFLPHVQARLPTDYLIKSIGPVGDEQPEPRPVTRRAILAGAILLALLVWLL